jgi:sialidase-1
MTISLFTSMLFADDGVSLQSAVINEKVMLRAIDTLHEGLQGDAFWPSMHAAEGLTLAGYGMQVQEVLAPKLPAVSDDRLRSGIARELVRAGDESKVAVLTELLLKNDPCSIVFAVEGLYKVGAVGDLDALRVAAHSSDNVGLSMFASGALIQSGEKAALEHIRSTYAKGDERSIRLAALVLGRVGAQADIPLLQSRIGAASEELTLSYIQHALALLGDEGGLKSVSENLYSKNPVIRADAASIAYIITSASAYQRLLEMLDDPHPDARYRAAQSILLLGMKINRS